MKELSRRSFVAGCAAAASGPALAAPRRQAPSEPARSASVEVVVVGAGAAGIAAARRLAAASRRFVVLEAADAVGGRCITDTRAFGTPFDLGARALYAADINPLARLATQAGVDIYPAPPGQRVRIGRRYAREGEMEDFLAGLVRASTAIADAARRGDMPGSQALPKDLGDWRATIELVLGPLTCGKELAEVSSADLSRAPDRDKSAFCRQGLGTLLARLAAGLPLQLASPVTAIEHWSRANTTVHTTKGQLRTSAVIVTVSTNVLSAGKIRFTPELPRRHLDGLSRLRLGSHDRIALELADNPLGLRADELVLEKNERRETAAMLANVGGSTLCVVDVAGSFGRELSGKGEAAMRDFAVGWLAGLYGSEVKAAVRRSRATRWNEEPWVLGAGSVAAPGAQTARRTLMEPVSNRVFLAGEAVHETLWGSIGGAWESGERAADAALKLLGVRR